MSPVSVGEAAAHFGVSTETVRRWVRIGAPCVRPGERGRGRGTLLNVDDISRWRAARRGLPIHDPPGDVMQRIERAMIDVLRRDGGDGQPIHVSLGVSQVHAVAILTEALNRIGRSLIGGG